MANEEAVTEEAVTEEAVTEEAVTEEAAPSLSVTDLVLLKNLIDITAQRGAIKPEEMKLVGEVHAKLVAFLTAAGAFATPEEVEANTTEDTPGE